VARVQVLTQAFAVAPGTVAHSPVSHWMLDVHDTPSCRKLLTPALHTTGSVSFNVALSQQTDV
jgi:hypothetical protein